MSEDNKSEDLNELLAGFSMSASWAKVTPEKYNSNVSKYSEKFDNHHTKNSSDNYGNSYNDRHSHRDDDDGYTKKSSQKRRFRSDRDGGEEKFYKNNSRRDDAEVKNDADSTSEAPKRVAKDDGDAKKPGRPKFQKREVFNPQDYPFELKFLPEQSALSLISKKLLANHRAIPLRNVVQLFFDRPDTTLIRLEFTKENRDKSFFQCEKCGWVSLNKDELVSHIVREHFKDYFEEKVVEDEPPVGNFTAVAKCGITGKLIGPPNHHSYNSVIRKMVEFDCVGVSEAEFRMSIELVKDSEVIEQWRQEAAKKTVYFAKDVEEKGKKANQAAKSTEATQENADKPALSYEEADMIFRRDILPSLVKEDKHIVVSRIVADKMPSSIITDAITKAWQHETRVKLASLFFAIRGGLKSRKINFFKVKNPRREEYLVAHKFVTKSENVAPGIAKILDYIKANPGTTRTSLLKALIPEGTDEKEAKLVRNNLDWMARGGMVIEFYNEVLAIPNGEPLTCAKVEESQD